jgi:hypothetical protein
MRRSTNDRICRTRVGVRQIMKMMEVAMRVRVRAAS